MEGIKDPQLISEDGTLIHDPIDGLKIHLSPSIEDDRGELVEVFRSTWNIHPDPLVFCYVAAIRPGKTKVWIVHKKQDDRIFALNGTCLWAFFDNRPDSPTYRNFFTRFFSPKSRALFVIPRGVYHGVKNIGTDEAQFINLPTRPYNRKDPDKYRLPLKNDLIPFDFNV